MATYEKRNIGGSTYTVPTGTRNDWKPGQAYSNTPSTPKTKTTTATKSSGGSTVTSSANSTYKSPSSGGINTSGLTGYAKAYADAINAGANDANAHQYSTAVNNGTGISGLNNQYENQANNPYYQLLQQQQQPQQQFDYMDMIDDILGRMPQVPTMKPALSYDAAQQQAQEFYNPMYGELMNKSLDAVDQSNVRRGFFGQLPGAALQRSTAADVENKKAQAIGQFANQLVGQSQDYSLGLQQAAQQQYQAQANALMSALNAAVNYQGNEQGNMINLYNAMINQQRADQEKERDIAELAQILQWGGAF